MSKKINLVLDGKEYVLEYNRKTVRTLENAGFSLSKLTDMPVTMIPMLFYGAFAMHHPAIRRDQADAIFDEIANKSDLIVALVELYSEPAGSLVGDRDTGNGLWEMTN